MTIGAFDGKPKHDKKGWRGKLVADGIAYNFNGASINTELAEPANGAKVEFTPAVSGKGKPVATNLRVLEPPPQASDQAAQEPLTGQPPASRDDGKAPYTFVPVITEHEQQSPLFPARFHDGKKTDSEPLFSGELRFTLTALTPLLVGQHRFPVTALLGDAPEIATIQVETLGGKKTEYKPRSAVEVPASWGIGYPGKNNRYWVEYDEQKPRKIKQVLQPQFIGDADSDSLNDKRVLIPATSLKGMLRHNLGAMLNAPMERVQEQYFSYRPNLKKPQGQVFESRPAIVERLDGDTVHIRLLSAIGDAILVETPANATHRKTTETALVPGARVNPSTLTGYYRSYSRLKLEHGKTPDLTDSHKVLSYRDGIDGSGLLSKSSTTTHAKTTTRAKHFFRALVAESKFENAQRQTIEPSVYRHYLRTQRELADLTHGHLSRQDGVDGKEAISDQIAEGRFEAHQLIYVEIHTAGRGSRVVSCGHHYRYRWGYNDTVRSVADPKHEQRQPRPELSPLSGETVTAAGGMLSGARALFGMASDRSDESGTSGIGGGSYDRLAGRIAINHAVEQVQAGQRKAQHRFLTTTHPRSANRPAHERTLIPLAILGKPCASAVEHYLEQTDIEDIPGATRTYGDLADNDPPGAALNGRKFYRHQTIPYGDDALSSGKVALDKRADRPGFVSRDEREEFSNQATLARYISRNGSRFRFTLRYRDLKLWELGALLAALTPDLLRDIDPASRPREVNEVIRRLEKKRPDDERYADEPLFACKLGYGRPLGLGSVGVELSGVRELAPEMAMREPDLPLEQWRNAAISAFLAHTTNHQLALAEWLEVCRYVRRPRVEYPTGEGGNIYDYHTDIRQRHAEDRRRRETKEPQNYGERVKARLDD